MSFDHTRLFLVYIRLCGHPSVLRDVGLLDFVGSPSVGAQATRSDVVAPMYGWGLPSLAVLFCVCVCVVVSVCVCASVCMCVAFRCPGCGALGRETENEASSADMPPRECKPSEMCLTPSSDTPATLRQTRMAFCTQRGAG